MFRSEYLNPKNFARIIHNKEHVGKVLNESLDYKKRQNAPFFQQQNEHIIHFWHSFDHNETFLQAIIDEQHYEDMLNYQLNNKECWHCSINLWIWAPIPSQDDPNALIEQQAYVNKVAFLIYDFIKNGNTHIKRDYCKIPDYKNE
jgi:hypothetical protein